jgi:hypothetical protein
MSNIDNQNIEANNRFVVRNFTGAYRYRVSKLVGTYTDKCKYEFEASLVQYDLSEQRQWNGDHIPHEVHIMKSSRMNFKAHLVRIKEKARRFEIRSQLRDSKFEQIYGFNGMEFHEVSDQVKLHWFDKYCNFKQPILYKGKRNGARMEHLIKNRMLVTITNCLGALRRYWKRFCHPRLRYLEELLPCGAIGFCKSAQFHMNKYRYCP